MLPNGVAVVGIDFGDHKTGMPAFPHGMKGRKALTQKADFEKAMRALSKKLPPNHIRWDDVDRYEKDFGYLVVDVFGKSHVPRSYAQSLKVKYTARDFQGDGYKKVVYRHLPTELDAQASISKMSERAQERLIEESFRIEVIYVVHPEDASDGETDFDRAADVDRPRGETRRLLL